MEKASLDRIAFGICFFVGALDPIIQETHQSVFVSHPSSYFVSGLLVALPASFMRYARLRNAAESVRFGSLFYGGYLVGVAATTLGQQISL